MGFKKVGIEELDFNPFNLLGKDWMVLSVGNDYGGTNAMTICWGSFGPIWHTKEDGKGPIYPTVCVFVRPQRYTHELIEKHDYFALSTLADKKALAYLGSHSGKYSDKIRNAGLSVSYDEDTRTAFVGESDMVFICRKIYKAGLREEDFVDKKIMENNYPNKDFHDIYIAEIVKVLVKE
jgi:hypothetical protein